MIIQFLFSVKFKLIEPFSKSGIGSQ